MYQSIINFKCPECNSIDIKLFRRYETKTHGKRCIFECKCCNYHFSETKNTFLENLRTPISTIEMVLKARTEGMGLNASGRTFGFPSNTIAEWEKRFAALKKPLQLYAIAHDFISQQIEGDELYTKVGKNKNPNESEGWTIVIMERVSRFIWELKCGKKEEKLFIMAMNKLFEIIEKTGDLSLFTDGERRYGNILFNLCCEVVSKKNTDLEDNINDSGKDITDLVENKAQSEKVLPKGVKVRLKNKGSKQAKENKPKYETPQKEHPETKQDIKNEDIHANHVEGFNAATRRNNSAYRRKTNTYAKNTDGLQRTLDAHWVVHNFIKKHFTTGKIPAIAIGIITSALSWQDIFSIQFC